MLSFSVIVGAVFFLLRRFYLKTSRSVKRLEGVTKSPIFNQLSSSLNGLSTIRAFKGMKIKRNYNHKSYALSWVTQNFYFFFLYFFFSWRYDDRWIWLCAKHTFISFLFLHGNHKMVWCVFRLDSCNLFSLLCFEFFANAWRCFR